MYDQKKLINDLFVASPGLLSDEGIKYLTTPQVYGSDMTILEDLKVLIKGTTPEIIALIKSTAKEFNDASIEAFKPENVIKGYADYADAMSMLGSMRLDNMPSGSADERKAKATAVADAEYQATVDGYLKLNIAYETYAALAEQAEIQHNTRL
jgi:hypothetical protein